MTLSPKHVFESILRHSGACEKIIIMREANTSITKVNMNEEIQFQECKLLKQRHLSLQQDATLSDSHSRRPARIYYSEPRTECN